MTREDTIFQLIADMKESLGELRGEMDGGFKRIEENQKEFRVQLIDLFRKHQDCPGPHVAGALAALREEFTAHRDLTTTTKVRKDSDDKISRPPRAVVSDKTIQLLIVLAAIALGGGGLIAQLVLQ